MWHMDTCAMTLVSDYAKATRLQKSKPKPRPKHKLANWSSEATNLSKGAIHCNMNRRFCANCPATPPCTFATPEELRKLEGREGLTSIWPCKLCTKEMRIKWTKTDTGIGTDRCPCWEKAPKSRIIEYKKWRAKYEKDNILTAERRKVYGKKRTKSSIKKRVKQTEARYSEGRICAAEECDNRITDRNTTGYCRQHTWVAKEINNR